MWKKITAVVALFLSSFVILYYSPFVFNPNAVIKPKTTKTTKVPTTKLTKPHNRTINTTDFSRFIGESREVLEAELGPASTEYVTSGDTKWLVYSSNSNSYLKFALNESTNKIERIFVSGSQADISPFKMGMTIEDIIDVTPLYANFEVELHEQIFQIELSESDMNKIPLVAFANKSFGVLVLNQEGKLIAIEYVDQEALLRSNLYTVISKTPLPVQDFVQRDPNELQLAQAKELLDIINQARQQEEQVPLQYDATLSQLAKTTLDEFITHPEPVLSSKKRQEAYAEVDIPTGTRLLHLPTFILSSKEKIRLKPAGVTKIYYGSHFIDSLQFAFDSPLNHAITQPLSILGAEKVGIAIVNHQLLILTA